MKRKIAEVVSIETMKILVTGTGGGLGRHLAHAFNAIEVNRTTPLTDTVANLTKPLDAIIHCAANNAPDVQMSELYGYLQDNVFLTEQLVRIPHHVFIQISTVAIYPPVDTVHTEDSLLSTETASHAYSMTKMMSEAIVREQCEKHLILRPTAMLGTHSRPNSAIRILTKENCRLSLSGKSAFNYILHDDVTTFIQTCLDEDITGTFNLASEGRMTLEDIAAQYLRRAEFGTFLYQIGTIDNTKAKAILPAFGRKSEETLQIFAKHYLGIEPPILS